MSRTEKVVAIILFIVLLIANLVGIWELRELKSSLADNSELIQVKDELSKKDTEIISLQNSLALCQQSKSVDSTTTYKSPVVEIDKEQVPVKKVEKKKVNLKSKPVTSISEAVEIVIKSETEVVDDYKFPSYFYENGTEGVKFCIRLGESNKRHLPHLGIDMGVIKISDFAKTSVVIEGNDESGYNWVAKKTATDLIGDCGLTKDGTFFVSVKLIEAFLVPSDNGKVELKAPATNWQPKEMTLFDGYYIYRVK